MLAFCFAIESGSHGRRLEFQSADASETPRANQCEARSIDAGRAHSITGFVGCFMEGQLTFAALRPGFTLSTRTTAYKVHKYTRKELQLDPVPLTNCSTRSSSTSSGLFRFARALLMLFIDVGRGMG